MSWLTVAVAVASLPWPGPLSGTIGNLPSGIWNWTANGVGTGGGIADVPLTASEKSLTSGMSGGPGGGGDPEIHLGLRLEIRGGVLGCRR